MIYLRNCFFPPSLAISLVFFLSFIRSFRRLSQRKSSFLPLSLLISDNHRMEKKTIKEYLHKLNIVVRSRVMFVFVNNGLKHTAQSTNNNRNQLKKKLQILIQVIICFFSLIFFLVNIIKLKVFFSMFFFFSINIYFVHKFYFSLSFSSFFSRKNR